MRSTILLVAALQGLLIVPALFFRPAKHRFAQFCLGLLVFAFAMEMLFAWGGYTGSNDRPGLFPFWLFRSYLIIPAALGLFFHHQMRPAVKTSRAEILCFLPAALDITFSASYHLSGGHAFRLDRWLWLFWTDRLPALLTLGLLFFWSFKLWAAPRTRHAGKLTAVLAVCGLLTLIWLLESFFSADLQLLFQTFTSIVLFSLAYLLYFDPAFFDVPKPSRPVSFAGYDDRTELVRLKDSFEKAGIYRRQRLTLAQLAAELGLPVKYTSYLIGQLEAGNFTEVINRYRVNEVIARMPVEKHKTLVGIALDAGFSSKSTFQQVFKQQTGKTPSEFLSEESSVPVPDVNRPRL